MELEEMLRALNPQQREALEGLLKLVNGKAPQTAKYENPVDGIEGWLNKLKVSGYSARTIRTYEYACRQYLAIDPRPTHQTIQNYLAKRLDDGMSGASVRSMQKSLKSLFTYLYEEGLWGENPLEKMKMFKEEKREREMPTDDQIAALLYGDWKLHSKIGTLRMKTLLAILADTGTRLTEAASILRKNIKLTAPMQIKVFGKGRKERILPINPYCAVLISKLMEKTPDSDYLFAGREKYWDISSIEENLRRVCTKLKIKPVTPHQIRHWWATRAMQAGMKIEVASRLLGHSSVGITGDIYRHITSTEMAEEHRQFSPLSRIEKQGDK
ncbi:Tyrosine recombinase XerD [subsurface metagenome]